MRRRTPQQTKVFFIHYLKIKTTNFLFYLLKTETEEKSKTVVKKTSAKPATPKGKCCLMSFIA